MRDPRALGQLRGFVDGRNARDPPTSGWVLRVRAAVGEVEVAYTGVLEGCDCPFRLRRCGIADDDDLDVLVRLGENRGECGLRKSLIVRPCWNGDRYQRLVSDKGLLVFG